MKPVASQQLAVLRAKNIIAGRKEGTSVRYLVRDPLIGELLTVARRIFNNHLVGTPGICASSSDRGVVGKHSQHTPAGWLTRSIGVSFSVWA